MAYHQDEDTENASNQAIDTATRSPDRHSKDKTTCIPEIASHAWKVYIFTEKVAYSHNFDGLHGTDHYASWPA